MFHLSSFQHYYTGYEPVSVCMGWLNTLVHSASLAATVNVYVSPHWSPVSKCDGCVVVWLTLDPPSPLKLTV